MLAAWWVLASVSQASFLVVPPYQQPGDFPGLAVEGRDLSWVTARDSPSLRLEYRIAGREWRAAARRTATIRAPGELRLSTARLAPLPFDAVVEYRLLSEGRVVDQGRLRTRSRGDRVRFVALGDSGAGTDAQREIAYRVHGRQPDFVLHTGDLVYDRGVAREYLARLFPVYNARSAGPRIGAPLLRDVPLYSALGNHDAQAADLRRWPDGLAFFTFLSFPLNGPSDGVGPRLVGRKEGFAEIAGPRFPKMASYSFDWGPLHVVVLDSNWYVPTRNSRLAEWLERDLASTDRPWRIVCFHAPAFHSSRKDFDYQKMRWFAPIFERHRVALVLSGHAHNYQRSRPLRFAPAGSSGSRVLGHFRIDTRYDGRDVTTPDGVIYVVTGAGGAPLYDRDFSDRPDRWRRADPTWAPFTARLVSDRHSFTEIAVEGDRLTLRQFDRQGREFDRIVVTRPVSSPSAAGR